MPDVRATATLGLSLGLGLGCQVADSDTCSYATDELSVVATVVDHGDIVRAEIDFEAGDRAVDAPSLTVCGDETLRIGAETPRRTDRAERIVYSANLSPDARDVTFALDRPDGAISLTITLPDAFDIVAPTTGQMVSRGEDTLLQWEPPGADDQMRIELGEEIGGGVCIYTVMGEHHYKDLGGVDVPDAGQWTIPADTVRSDLGGSCGAHYTLKRIVQGQYPAALHEGGYIEARVERTVTFESVP